MSTEIAVSLPAGIHPEGSEASSDDQLIELWLHERSLHTQRAYRADVGRFRAWAAKPLRAVMLADLQNFANSLTQCSGASRYRTLSAVKSLIAFGHRLGYLPFDVGRALRLPSVRNRLTNEFSPKLNCIASSVSNRSRVTAPSSLSCMLPESG